jgi:ankyrin repeat protein
LASEILFEDKRTALVVASEHGKLEIVKLLLSRGTNVNSRGKNIFQLIMAALKQLLQDGYYSTALQAASAWSIPVSPSDKKLEIVKLLLSHGADVNSIGENIFN